MIKRAILLVALATVPLAAQVVEAPVPFDSAGKIRSMTPALVARFGLTAPTWPVQGDFVEARLFSVSTGGSVLAVERRDRQVERYVLDAAAVQALHSAVDEAMTRTGAPVGEERPEVISEPARGAFIRNQMIAAALWYGPQLAALSDNGSTASALYLLSIGGTYFIASGISNRTSITRAQNHLATDGAVRGSFLAGGLLYTLLGEGTDAHVAAFTTFSGAVLGSITGFQRAKGMTDSEAEATTYFSTYSAATALGVIGTTGILDDSDEGTARVVVGSVIGAGIAGYALGPRYPRRAKYTVTGGDVQMLRLASNLGIMVGLTPVVESEDAHLIFAGATVGMLTGALLADRGWVRAFDHTTGDVGQVYLGSLAGALMGGALLTVAKPDSPTAIVGTLAAGAVLGALAGHNLAKPDRAGARPGQQSPGDGALHLGSTRLYLTPENLALAAAGAPGRHALATLRF